MLRRKEPIPTREQRKQAAERAAEFRQFRADFLFSQEMLAGRIGCSKRCVSDIELGVTINPRPLFLRRFRELKQEEMLKLHRFDMEMTA
jgi:DNA-binding XRE family transcriptional regulator